MDIQMSDTAWYADVIFPESTYLERWDDVYPASFREPFVALRQPAVEPMYDSKPGWWMARELATRLGLEAYFPWTDVETYVDTRLRARGLSIDAMRETGVHEEPAAPLYIEDGLEPVFHTPSGKIELYSTTLTEAPRK